ncbi:hypothetical protein PsorP6_005336 [Peronosclerospora sorghi]|uniref:Uncharacterized protein n=1 Tax=Peronosclerospora sorghi TaxID=230839 RepID=A0ACC0W334_9STRA|nr:hypothetical protein PsorP6_005336 [Peronosclerospora sorghi]
MHLLVEGMMCQRNCGSTIENALRALDGVANAIVTFEERKATVTMVHADSITLEELVEAVEGVGFQARVYDADEAAAIILQAEKEKQQQNDEEEVVVDVPDADGYPRAVFHVEGMSCAACVKAIEDYVGKSDGVLYCRVGLISQKAEVSFDRDVIHDEQREITKFIADAGYKATFLHVVEPGDDDSFELKFSVTGMSCAACVDKIETAVGKLPGVTKVGVNLPLNTVHVHLRQLSKTGPRDVLECIKSLGYSAKVAIDTTDHHALSKSEVENWRKLLTTAMIFSLPASLIHMVLMYIPAVDMVLMTPIFNAISFKLLILFLLATPVQFGVGWRFYVAAWKGLQHGAMGMDFLVVAGTTMSYTYSFVSLIRSALHKHYEGHHFFESSAMLLTFVTLGKYMESMAKGKTADALSELAKLQPKTALLIREGKRDREIPVELVQRGDLLRILPGANIPTDGVVKSGTSSIDESMLTGESIPVSKKQGDYVFGSTTNQQGTLVVESSCMGSESSALSQICALIEDAQLHKAPIQAYADWLASIFAPCVLGMSIMTFIAWITLLSLDLIPSTMKAELGIDALNNQHADDVYVAMLFAISVVVIACPCALGLATPTAVMVGCGVGAKLGVLIKGGRALETARYIDTIVFDKTGTLTVGRPSVTDVVVVDRAYTPRQILYYSASLERVSEHVLGKAIVVMATDVEKLELHDPTHVDVVPGRGIKGIVPTNERRTGRPALSHVFVGNLESCEQQGIEMNEKIRAHVHALEVEGKTVVVVCVQHKLVGLIALADAARPEATAVVKRLKSMGLDVWLITGDNLRTASAIAHEMGIHHVKAVALPGEKASQIKALQSQVNPLTARPRVVCMVGDGINDAPALAQSDVGMAIGAGTQIAKAEADMVLVKNALTDVVVALDLARVVFRRIKLNFFFSIVYNLIGIPLAAGMLFPLLHQMMPPACAGLAMAFSSVSVVLSSLLLKKYKAPLVGEMEVVHDVQEDGNVLAFTKKVWQKLGCAPKTYMSLAKSDEVRRCTCFVCGVAL